MSSEQDEEENGELPPTMERWPDGTVLYKRFRSCSHLISDMTVRDSDVWVVTYPKSGTTWTQEIVWLLTNNLDFDFAKKVPLTKRSKFLEFPTMLFSEFVEGLDVNRFMEKIDKSTEPRRNLKTHLFWTRLPKQLQNPDAKAKIIYVARNPKDVCVSLFNFIPQLGHSEHIAITDSLENYSNKFMTNRVLLSPYWTHIKDFWSRRNQANILFLWYEDMKRDLRKEIDKLVKFLEVPSPSPNDMKRLLDHVSFASMKKNPSVNEASPSTKFKGGEDHGVYVRKGKVGAWKEEMPPEIAARFDYWISQNTAGTDLEEFFKDRI